MSIQETEPIEHPDGDTSAPGHRALMERAPSATGITGAPREPVAKAVIRNPAGVSIRAVSRVRNGPGDRFLSSCSFDVVQGQFDAKSRSVTRLNSSILGETHTRRGSVGVH